MITVKISDLLNSVEQLQKLSRQDFKAKLAWQVARLLKAAENEIQSFNDTRISLINKYGDKDETNNRITDDAGNCKISPDKVTAFNEELNELLNTEVELNANKLDFEQMQDLSFTPNDIFILKPFLDGIDD